MANKVKLENIMQAGSDQETGDRFLNITEEYVCGNCRHLVEAADKFCWYCRSELRTSDKIEHWQKGVQIAEDTFQKIRGTLEAR